MTSARKIMNEIAQKSSILHHIDGDEKLHLQRTLLSILKDVHRVCVDYDINYFLVGGTALGAVRHKGFIPWDDDIDISMLREDWTKFKEIFQQNLGYKYVLEGPNYENKDSKATFGKVYLKNTELVEIQHINAPYHNGIYIDIFIYDNMSNNKAIRVIDARAITFLNGTASSQIYYRYPNEYLKAFYSNNIKTRLYYYGRRALGFMFSWISHKSLCNFIDKFQSRHPISQYVTAPAGRKGYIGEVLRRDEILPAKLIKFEDSEFYTFKNVKDYLTQLYGNDYMQLPPENKRERHCVYKLTFPKQ